MQTLNKQFKCKHYIKQFTLCVVDILGLCRDISKLLLGIVSHRCSDSLLYLCLYCIYRGITTGKNTFSLAFPRILSNSSTFPWPLLNSLTFPGFPGWCTPCKMNASSSSNNNHVLKRDVDGFITSRHHHQFTCHDNSPSSLLVIVSERLLRRSVCGFMRRQTEVRRWRHWKDQTPGLLLHVYHIITSSFNRIAWQPQTIYIHYFIHSVNNADSCCGETVVAVTSNGWLYSFKSY